MANMTVLNDNLTPALKPNVNFATLSAQPTPEEFFVLSRINGQLTIAQLCAVTGLGREKTLLALQKLREVGLLEMPNLDAPDTQPSTSTPAENHAEAHPNTSTENNTKPTSTAPNYDLLPIAFEDFTFDHELLAQQVEIDDQIKQEILYLFGQLHHINHYQLLGVPPTATRKELRNGYFALSRRFHPDLFFRKLLGDYETRIEKLFQRTVKAYETLSHQKKRAAYDESLSSDTAPHAPSIPASLTDPPSEPGDDPQTSADKKRDMAFTILVSRGDGHAAANDWAKACDEYKNALRVKRDPELALRVAHALLDTRTESDLAFLFARAALKMDEDCIDALLILGELYQRSDAPDEALTHYQRALQIAPTRVDIQQQIDSLRG